jgi:hypothetical protein
VMSLINSFPGFKCDVKAFHLPLLPQPFIHSRCISSGGCPSDALLFVGQYHMSFLNMILHLPRELLSFLFFFFFAVLGFELRALYLQSRYSMIWAMPLALFALVILKIGSHSLAQAGLDHSSPILYFLL